MTEIHRPRSSSDPTAPRGRISTSAITWNSETDPSEEWEIVMAPHRSFAEPSPVTEENAFTPEQESELDSSAQSHTEATTQTDVKRAAKLQKFFGEDREMGLQSLSNSSDQNILEESNDTKENGLESVSVEERAKRKAQKLRKFFGTDDFQKAERATSSSSSVQVKRPLHVDFKWVWRGADPAASFIRVKKLGEGLFGKVYKGHHKASKFELAIRCVENELAKDAQSRIMKELDDLKQFRSKYIVSHFGQCISRNQIWILQEYCTMGSVQEILDKMKKHNQCFKEKDIAYFLKTLVAALAYLHSNGIIHGNVKASNILFTHEFQAKIADFGSASLANEIVSTRGIMGCPLYVSPEILSGRDMPDKASDIWAAGITAIQLVDWDPPYKDHQPSVAVLKICLQPSPTLRSPDRWSQELNDFISSCLAKNPLVRPSAEMLYQHAVFKQVPQAHTPTVFLHSDGAIIPGTVQNVVNTERGRTPTAEDVPGNVVATSTAAVSFSNVNSVHGSSEGKTATSLESASPLSSSSSGWVNAKQGPSTWRNSDDLRESTSTRSLSERFSPRVPPLSPRTLLRHQQQQQSTTPTQQQQSQQADLQRQIQQSLQAYQPPAQQTHLQPGSNPENLKSPRSSSQGGSPRLLWTSSVFSQKKKRDSTGSGEPSAEELLRVIKELKKKIHSLEKELACKNEQLSDRAVTINLQKDRIEYHEVLGGGGSGALVFRCSVKGFSFAAKIMRTNAQPEEVQPLVSEISIMMQLKHDNIVKYIESEMTSNSVKLFMEIYSGTLRQVINDRAVKNKPFAKKDVIGYLFQIAKGLNYLHTQEPPIIHRDLKSENIFVTWDSQKNPITLRIGDFDTSKVLSAGKLTYTHNIGTPGFIAPEIYSMGHTVKCGHGTQADIWSLGMLMYELLTLKRPYYDVPYLQISEFNAAGIRPMVPEELAKEYKEVITLFDKCICKEPSKRPSAKRLITKLGKL